MLIFSFHQPETQGMRFLYLQPSEYPLLYNSLNEVTQTNVGCTGYVPQRMSNGMPSGVCSYLGQPLQHATSRVTAHGRAQRLDLSLLVPVTICVAHDRQRHDQLVIIFLCTPQTGVPSAIVRW